MASKQDWRKHVAQVIYRAYPDSDLLPVDPPMAGETIGDFAVRAEGAGDTLFLFLCREANDDIMPTSTCTGWIAPCAISNGCMTPLQNSWPTRLPTYLPLPAQFPDPTHIPM